MCLKRNSRTYHGESVVEGRQGGKEDAGLLDRLHAHGPVLHEKGTADKDNLSRGISQNFLGLVVAEDLALYRVVSPQAVNTRPLARMTQGLPPQLTVP